MHSYILRDLLIKLLVTVVRPVLQSRARIMRDGGAIDRINDIGRRGSPSERPVVRRLVGPHMIPVIHESRNRVVDVVVRVGVRPVAAPVLDAR